jgi:hypothetical protein
MAEVGEDLPSYPKTDNEGDDECRQTTFLHASESFANTKCLPCPPRSLRKRGAKRVEPIALPQDHG